MGIFDLLFPDSSKKIYHEDFKKALYQISALSSKEKAYIEDAFKDDLKGGLSKYEIKQRCSELLHKSGDSLDSYEVEQIKNKLLKYF